MTKSDILNYLKEHFQEFHNKYNVEKIGLFGSYQTTYRRRPSSKSRYC
jgi:predicted nucleotidyltransferase